MDSNRKAKPGTVLSIVQVNDLSQDLDTSKPDPVILVHCWLNL